MDDITRDIATGKLDERPVALLYTFLDDAAPTDAIVVQLAVPFVIGKCLVAGFERKLRHVVVRPGL